MERIAPRPGRRSRPRRAVARRLVFMVTAERTAIGFLGGYLARLAEHGFEVTIVAASQGGLEPFAAEQGVRARSIAMVRDPSPAADARSLAAVRRLLRELRPEIVVTATPKASLLGMVAAAAGRVPVRVYQVWGLRSETEHGARRWMLRSAERITLRTATHIVANSHSLAGELRALAPGRRVDVVGAGSSHGVDLERFSPSAPMPQLPSGAQQALSGDRLVVGSIGRVHRDKGTLSLLRAMRGIAEERAATLLVVGSDEDEETERALAEAGGALRVVRVDAVPDPRPWFLAMDIHVLPTLREGFPNVVLEASALGVPTITTTATGARDSVLHERTGLLVPPNDDEALRAAISRLAGDPTMRARLAGAARARAARHFSSQLVLRGQVAYLEAARSGAAPPARSGPRHARLGGAGADPQP